jgi:hypothetical protein
VFNRYKEPVRHPNLHHTLDMALPTPLEKASRELSGHLTKLSSNLSGISPALARVVRLTLPTRHPPRLRQPA